MFQMMNIRWIHHFNKLCELLYLYTSNSDLLDSFVILYQSKQSICRYRVVELLSICIGLVFNTDDFQGIWFGSQSLYKWRALLSLYCPFLLHQQKYLLQLLYWLSIRKQFAKFIEVYRQVILFFFCFNEYLNYLLKFLLVHVWFINQYLSDCMCVKLPSFLNVQINNEFIIFFLSLLFGYDDLLGIFMQICLYILFNIKTLLFLHYFIIINDYFYIRAF